MEQLIIALWGFSVMKGLFVIAFLSSVIVFMGLAFSSNTYSEIKQKIDSLRVFFSICICITVLWAVTPSEKVILMYAGVKGGEAIANSPEFEKAMALFNKTIDSYLKEDNK